MSRSKSITRTQKEVMLSAAMGLGVGICLAILTSVPLFYFYHSVLSHGAGLYLKREFAVSLMIVLGIGGICGVLAGWLRASRYATKRMGQCDNTLFEKLTSELPAMVYQFRQYPHGHCSVTYTNSAIHEIYELSPEEALKDGGKILNLVHPEDRNRIWKMLVESWWNLTPWQGEYRVVLPKKGECWRFAQAHVERLPDGSTLWHGFVSDITWRKKAEEELRSHRERLALATSAAGIGIWEYDLKSEKFFMDDQMLSIHGILKKSTDYTVAEWNEGFTEEARQQFWTMLKKAAQGNSVLPIELPRRSGGMTNCILCSAAKVKDSTPQATRVVGTCVDISIQRETAKDLLHAKEVAEEADRVKSEFLAMMSHEIRTPMNGIIGFTNLLKETPVNQEQDRYLQIIESSAETLLVIINDILDLSKIELGRLQITSQPFKIRNAVEEVVTILSPRAVEKGISIHVSFQGPVPEGLISDRVRLMQILLNLVGNAIKFTSKGSVSIAISAHPDGIEHAKDGSIFAWEFVIRDTGIGINSELRKKIFEPFYQVESTSKRRFGGTGLGLSITKRLCEMLKAKISLKSEVGVGSEFTVLLHAPVVFSNIGNWNLPEATTESYDKIFEGMHLLVVEDNEINQKLVELLLRRLGCTHTLAENGVEAVEMCGKEVFDAVLMDLHLPEMDGLEATVKIRELEGHGLVSSKNGRLPIIAVTASAMMGTRNTCIEAGMDDYLSKPIRLNQLQETLQRLCAGLEQAPR